MTGEIPTQPGRCPDEWWTGPDYKEEWRDYCQRSEAYWRYLADGLSALVPCQGYECIGGGSIISVIYEDKSWAWLGGSDTEDVDGPYAFGRADWVGGYRYQAESCGEIYTQRLMIPVPDPDDAQSVIDSLASVARSLFTMDFTESV